MSFEKFPQPSAEQPKTEEAEQSGAEQPKIEENEKIEDEKIEKQEKEKKFNIEKEITEQDLENIEGFFKDWGKESVFSGGFNGFSSLAIDLKMINPDRFSEEKLITDKNRKKMEKQWRKDISQKEHEEFSGNFIHNKGFQVLSRKVSGKEAYVNTNRFPAWSHIFVEMKTLGTESDPEPSDQDWGTGKAFLEEYAKSEEIQEYLYLAQNMKIIDPVSFEAEIGISDEAWQKAKALLEKHREEKKWDKFLETAKEMKVLDTERFSTDVNIENEDREGAKEFLDDCREKILNSEDKEYLKREGWDFYSGKEILKSRSTLGIISAIEHMKIIDADKVEISENGLKIE